MATVPPDKIAFTSFTRQAAYGARHRAAEKYNLLEDDLPWFRTMHSLAFNAIGMTMNEIMKRSDYKEFCEGIGYQWGHGIELGPAMIGPEGNVCLALIEYARATMQTLMNVYHEHRAIVPWKHLVYFKKELDVYKKERGLFDFTDILEMYIKQGSPLPVQDA